MNQKHDTPDDIDTWEELSSQVLNAIKCLIDALRSAPYPRERVIDKPGKLACHNEADFSLTSHFRSVGIFDVVQQLNALRSQSNEAQISDTDSAIIDERHQVLHDVIFPLMIHLQNCYAVLDNAPQPTAPYVSDTRRKNKPIPSKGMLSLKDYTNVACLLEFAVCTSLLPQMGHYSFLDENREIDRSSAMMLAQKRCRSLPKSLAGRILPQSLTWGMNAAAGAWNVEQQTSDDNLQRITMLNQNHNELLQLSNAIGGLVLLDRFRPMLLPRHLDDLFMTLLFLERCKWSLDRMMKCPIEGDEGLCRIQSAVLFTPLQLKAITSMQNPTNQIMTNIEFRPIDCREAAFACRTLLGGKAGVVMSSESIDAHSKQNNLKIPPWMRMRLGQCLTKLAEDDLHAVVDVFVASARGMGSDSTQEDKDVMTGAAARLARALCATPSSSNGHKTIVTFQKLICDQFIDYLVDEGDQTYKALVDEKKKSKRVDTERKLSRSGLAMMYTLWATIGQLTEEGLQSFAVRLCSGLIPLDQDKTAIRHLTSLQSIFAIWMWLSAIPSSVDSSVMKKTRSIILGSILSDESSGCCTMLGQTLRLVTSTKSKLVSEMDAENTALRHIVEITFTQLVRSLFQEERNAYLVAVELINAVTVSQFDRQGYAFSYPLETSNDSYESKIYIRSSGNSQASDSVILQQVEQRGCILVDSVIVPIADVVERILVGKEKIDASDGIEYSLPSIMFRLVLIIHFYASHSTNDDGDIAGKVNSKLSEYGLVDLVLGKDFHAFRIAGTTILAYLCEKCSPASILMGKMHGQKELNADVLELLGIIIDCAAHNLKMNAIASSSSSAEELFSTTSIVVSLLVSLLELGVTKRADNDESILRTMMPSLQILSQNNHFRWQRKCKSDSSDQLAELAEMSSHAMALIASRSSEFDNSSTEKQVTAATKFGIDLVADKLSLAERDLRSRQPPLRAKAVVSLRHLARSLYIDSVESEDKEVKTILVTEVDAPSQSAAAQDVELDQSRIVVNSLARLSFISLSDAESYVYLAGIQTLVAICDVSPSEILPLTATLVAKGVISDLAVLSADAKVSSVTISLTPEERIKCAEALIFMIRRRGESIYAYSRLLFDLMLFGTQQSHQEHLSQHHYFLLDIQDQTHSYFVGTDDETDNNDNLHERRVRLNTGGPVFEMEEDDLLRSTSISIVCELISVLQSASIVSYCRILVKLAIDALRLDDSRPVRRAAASLARDLYASVENELVDALHPTSSMAVAMLCSQEDVLYSVLQSCASGNAHYLDTATQSRCTEAIDLRDHLQSLAVFDAAALISDSLKVESEPVVKAVRKALS